MKNYRVLASFFLLLVFSCGSDQDASRISVFNGVDPNEHPLLTRSIQESILKLNHKDRLVCSGTLITPRFAITAAHCLELSLDAKDYSVSNDSNSISRDVRRIFSPAARSGEIDRSLYPTFDMALVELAHPIESIIPIPLIQKISHMGRLTDKAYIAGYGKDESGTGTLTFGKVVARFPTEDLKKGNILIEPDPSRPCNGDSGGPLFISDGKQLRLAGLTHGVNPFTDGIAFPSADCQYNSTTYVSLYEKLDYIYQVTRSGAYKPKYPSNWGDFEEYCREMVKEADDFRVLKFLTDAHNVFECDDLAQVIGSKSYDMRFLGRVPSSFLSFGRTFKKVSLDNPALPILTRGTVIEDLDIRNPDRSLNGFLDQVHGLRELKIEGGDSNYIFDYRVLNKSHQLETLYLVNLGIDQMDFGSSKVHLKNLDLSNNKISNLSFLADVQNLNKINLSHNKIEDITPVTLLKRLKIGIFNYNPLSFDADLSGLGEAELLSFYGSKSSQKSIICPFTEERGDVCIF